MKPEHIDPLPACSVTSSTRTQSRGAARSTSSTGQSQAGLYKMGGEVSERQWGDILGILKVQVALDGAYLDEWADALDVMPLLARARNQTSPSSP